MTRKELLTTYRELVIELEELRHQLNRAGTDGRPRGAAASACDRICTGTNDPTAAAIQMMDGLEDMARRKEEELAGLRQPLDELLKSIRDFRTYMVIQHYYVLGRTDEQVARAISMSKSRVNQIRKSYLLAG